MHVLDRVMNVADEVIVAIGREDAVAPYKRLVEKSVRILKDRAREKSPLVGIVTGFEAMRSEYSLVLSCDTPFVKERVLEFLLDRAEDSEAAIPEWPNGDLEPLQSVYKVRSALPAAKVAVIQHGFRIVDMIRRLAVVTYVPVCEIKQLDNDLMTFFNVNSRIDLRHAEAIYGSRQ